MNSTGSGDLWVKGRASHRPGREERKERARKKNANNANCAASGVKPD
jgi:hypothetical protein